jgi:autoinducer 2-degrading protein
MPVWMRYCANMLDTKVKLDNSCMHILHVHVHVKPEHLDEFQTATIENASHSVQEPGCARFDVVQQTDDPTRFVLVEFYRDAQGLAAHRETPHYHAWIERVADMLVEPRTRTVYRNVHPGDDAF